jgi:hypothetical protein
MSHKNWTRHDSKTGVHPRWERTSHDGWVADVYRVPGAWRATVTTPGGDSTRLPTRFPTDTAAKAAAWKATERMRAEDRARICAHDEILVANYMGIGDLHSRCVQPATHGAHCAAHAKVTP